MVHLIYAIPADGQDRGLDVDGQIAQSFAVAQEWLAAQTGGRAFKLDTSAGAVDVTFVRLPSTDAQLAAEGIFLRDEIERLLRGGGFDVPGKLYLVYYDGTTQAACGGGSWPPALPGNVVALYLRGTPPGALPCGQNPLPGTPPGYWEFSALHELAHALGIVAECAPHHTRAGHTSDSPTDLMYAGDLRWEPQALDPGADDYFGHGRADCPDLAASPVLDGNPDSPAVPTTRSFAYRNGPVTQWTPSNEPPRVHNPPPVHNPPHLGTPVPTPKPVARCRVPNVLGLTAAGATRRLRRAGCARRPVRYRAARTRRERRRSGRVVLQSPRVGAVRVASFRVTLTVTRRVR